MSAVGYMSAPPNPCKDSPLVSDRAKYTYLGMSPSDVIDPQRELDWAPCIVKFQQRYHPDANLTPAALLVMDDIISDTLSRILTTAKSLAGGLSYADCPHEVWSHHLPRGTVEVDTPVVLDERTLSGNAQVLLGFFGDSKEWVWENDMLQNTKFVAKVNAWRALSPAAKKGIALQYARDNESSDYSAEKDACGQEIHCRALISSVRRCMPGRLGKHAVCEGRKAVETLHSTHPSTQWEPIDSGCPISRASGLDIPVELVGSISSLLTGCPVSQIPASFLGGALEYIAYEILELSNNAARDNNQSKGISPRHIFLGINNDEELRVMLAHVSILGGGVVPSILPAICTVPEIAEENKANYIASLVGAGAATEAPDLDPDDVFQHPFFKGPHTSKEDHWGGIDLFCNMSSIIHGEAEAEAVNEFCLGAIGEEAMVAARMGLEAAQTEVARLHEPGQPAILAAEVHFTAIATGEGGWAPPEVLPEVAAALRLETKCQDVLEVLMEHQAALAAPLAAAEDVPPPPPKRARTGPVIFNLDNISPSMLRALAARAGVAAMSELCFVSLRGEIRIRLEHFIRDIDDANECRRSFSMHLMDVVLSLRESGSVIAGTGRIGTVLKRSIRAPHLENSDQSQAGSSSAAANSNDSNESDGTRAAWEPLAVAARAEQRAWWESRTEDDEATAQRLLLRERHELMIPCPSEDATTLPAEADNVGAHHARALALIEAMQKRPFSPVIPSRVFLHLVAEIRQDFRTDCEWTPLALRVLNEVCESSLVRLLQLANLNATNRGAIEVEVRDIELANPNAGAVGTGAGSDLQDPGRGEQKA
eukprot:CAMPEP_0119473198 /NCGR_PEP_ID=MMETSP1344-20130328/4943_1 /TAXON_ID=236787 /ORGANISM="Florenciella parvula, Strain CCMP2471" /LENGTH=821 /DNA_ID=CAMNT_0007506259 /DNA_START=106 /DNA_END=2572 /DNA_ORIENTATION=+